MSEIFFDGTKVPFFVDDIEVKDISTADFSPSEDPSMSDTDKGKYLDKGFLVRAQADGNACVITLRQYLKNNKTVTGLTPIKVIMSANQWLECRVVKVYAKDDATYPSTIGDSTNDEINIGVIL